MCRSVTNSPEVRRGFEIRAAPSGERSGMEIKMYNVLMISESQGYLWMTLQGRLEQMGCKVIDLPADPDIISKVKDHIDLLFLLVDEGLLAQNGGLIYLKDKAVEESIPIFVTGDEENLEKIRNGIFIHSIQREFPRPINVGEVAEYLYEYMQNYGKQNKKKILVVDDSGMVLRSVEEWLGDTYQIFMANSGMMAVKYLTSNRPDLILLDYEMPVVDGSQVLEMIRSDPEFSDMPIIFLTGKSDKESVQKVMALKPDGYLLKTMPPEQIRQTIADFFEKRKAKMGK